MGENSKIEWCDNTFNPWIGCSKVSAGCANCYAETLMDKIWNKVEWGKGKERKLTSAANWKLPIKWNKEAAKEGIRKKVFCASLADVFDLEVSDDWRNQLMDLIYRTPNLDWLLLTKRPENALRYFSHISSLSGVDNWHSTQLFSHNLSEQQKENNLQRVFSHFKNIWIGTSVENQKAANERIPILLQIPAAKRFLSMEPLLSAIDFYGTSAFMPNENHPWRNCKILTGIDWVIVGGESGHNARPMHPEWARAIRDQCVMTNVKFLFKQWGEWAPRSGVLTGGGINWVEIDPQCKKYPDVIRLGEHGLNTRYSENCNDTMGEEIFMQKVGKKNTGRLLDGREWNEMPEAVNA